MLEKLNIEENFSIYMTCKDTSKLIIRNSKLEKEVIAYYHSMENILIQIGNNYHIDSINSFVWNVSKNLDKGIKIACVDHAIRHLYNLVVDMVNDKPYQLELYKDLLHISKIVLSDISKSLKDNRYIQV